MSSLKLQIKQRVDTEENWKKYNPVLLEGELAFTSDGTYTGAYKIGNGKAKWEALKYAFSEATGKILTMDDVSFTVDKNNVVSLKTTGVTAGTYGESAKTTNKDIVVPKITVNATGQITSLSAETITYEPKVDVVNIKSNYTAEKNNSLVLGSGYTVTLPSMTIGTKLTIKNTATDTAILSVIPDTGITIDDKSNVKIDLKALEFITLVSVSSTNWYIVAESTRISLDEASVSGLSLNDIVLQ